MKERIARLSGLLRTSPKRTLAVVALLLVAIALPLTVVVSQNQQNLEQHAAAPGAQATSGVYCPSGKSSKASTDKYFCPTWICLSSPAHDYVSGGVSCSSDSTHPAKITTGGNPCYYGYRNANSLSCGGTGTTTPPPANPPPASGCTNGKFQCVGTGNRQPQKCVNGGWVNQGSACTGTQTCQSSTGECKTGTTSNPPPGTTNPPPPTSSGTCKAGDSHCGSDGKIYGCHGTGAAAKWDDVAHPAGVTPVTCTGGKVCKNGANGANKAACVASTGTPPPAGTTPGPTLTPSTPAGSYGITVQVYKDNNHNGKMDSGEAAPSVPVSFTQDYHGCQFATCGQTAPQSVITNGSGIAAYTGVAIDKNNLAQTQTFTWAVNPPFGYAFENGELGAQNNEPASQITLTQQSPTYTVRVGLVAPASSYKVGDGPNNIKISFKNGSSGIPLVRFSFYSKQSDAGWAYFITDGSGNVSVTGIPDNVTLVQFQPISPSSSGEQFVWRLSSVNGGNTNISNGGFTTIFLKPGTTPSRPDDQITKYGNAFWNGHNGELGTDPILYVDTSSNHTLSLDYQTSSIFPLAFCPSGGTQPGCGQPDHYASYNGLCVPFTGLSLWGACAGQTNGPKTEAAILTWSDGNGNPDSPDTGTTGPGGPKMCNGHICNGVCIPIINQCIGGGNPPPPSTGGNPPPPDNGGNPPPPDGGNPPPPSGVCTDGAKQCSGNQPQTCIGGQWQNNGAVCTNVQCLAGLCAPREVSPTPPTDGQNFTTNIGLNLGLDAIGSQGDHVNPNAASSNKNPKRTTRPVTVEVYTSNNQVVGSAPGNVSYDPSSGRFKGTVDMGTKIPTGSYVVKVKSLGYLRKGSSIVQSLDGLFPEINVNLTDGDIVANGDSFNRINILDYNAFLSCSIFSKDSGALCNQDSSFRTNSDLNDNGIIDQDDYNYLLREWVVQSGD